MEQVVNMFLHDPSFVDAVVWCSAGDGLRGPCVDEELEATDGSPDSCCIETVPVVMEDRHEFFAKVSGEVIRDTDDAVKLLVVNGGLPYMDVVARGSQSPSWCI